MHLRESPVVDDITQLVKESGRGAAEAVEDLTLEGVWRTQFVSRSDHEVFLDGSGLGMGLKVRK